MTNKILADERIDQRIKDVLGHIDMDQDIFNALISSLMNHFGFI